MNLNELIESLQHIRGQHPRYGELTVAVPVTGESSIGARAFVGIKNASHGFDWEAGFVYLLTEESVTRSKKKNK